MIEFILPFSFAGFVLYLHFCYSQGNVLYFLSKPLRIWVLKGLRRSRAYRENAKDFWIHKHNIDSGGVVTNPQVLDLMAKADCDRMWISSVPVRVAQNRVQKRQQAPEQTTYNISAWDPKKYPDPPVDTAQMLFVDDEAMIRAKKEAKIHWMNAQKLATKYHKRYDRRDWIVQPLIECPVCMYFWYPIPFYAALNFIFGISGISLPWELYPIYWTAGIIPLIVYLFKLK